MPFKPGQISNPNGGKKAARFFGALERAIAADDGKRLRAAVEKLLDHAANGEPWAIGMLADRLDGKAPQFIDVRKSFEDLSDDELTRIVEGLRSALALAEARDGDNKPSEPEQTQALSSVH